MLIYLVIAAAAIIAIAMLALLVSGLREVAQGSVYRPIPQDKLDYDSALLTDELFD